MMSGLLFPALVGLTFTHTTALYFMSDALHAPHASAIVATFLTIFIAGAIMAALNAKYVSSVKTRLKPHLKPLLTQTILLILGWMCTVAGLKYTGAFRTVLAGFLNVAVLSLPSFFVGRRPAGRTMFVLALLLFVFTSEPHTHLSTSLQEYAEIADGVPVAEYDTMPGDGYQTRRLLVNDENDNNMDGMVEQQRRLLQYEDVAGKIASKRTSKRDGTPPIAKDPSAKSRVPRDNGNMEAAAAANEVIDNTYDTGAQYTNDGEMTEGADDDNVILDLWLFTVSEGTMGNMLLLAGSVLNGFREKHEKKKFAKEFNGAHRVTCIVMICAAIVVSPLLFVSLFTTEMEIITFTWPLLSVFTCVVGYYMKLTQRKLVDPNLLKAEQKKDANAKLDMKGSGMSFTLPGLAVLPSPAQGRSWLNAGNEDRTTFIMKMFIALVVGLFNQAITFAILLSSALVYAALTQEASYKAAHQQNALLPMSMSDDLDSSNNSGKKKPFSMKAIVTKLGRIWRHINSDKNTFRIFIFICINLAFMFVEVAYGFWSNSLGLISDAGHMFFDCVALAIGLYASYISSSIKANASYTYGYGRFEILSGFINGIFLVFVGFFVFVESVERLFEEPEITSDSLVVVSVLGFFVNLIGLIFFHDTSHGHSHGGGGGDHGHSHGGDDGENMNLYGIYLHILADALGSVGVIVSSLLIKYFDWTAADAICSIFISLLILVSVVPFLAQNCDMLLSKVPGRSAKKFFMTLDSIRGLPGVTNVEHPHLWSFTDGQSVGTVHVEVAADQDAQSILQQVTGLLKASKGGNVTSLTVQVNHQIPAQTPLKAAMTRTPSHGDIKSSAKKNTAALFSETIDFGQSPTQASKELKLETILSPSSKTTKLPQVMSPAPTAVADDEQPPEAEHAHEEPLNGQPGHGHSHHDGHGHSHH